MIHASPHPGEPRKARRLEGWGPGLGIAHPARPGLRALLRLRSTAMSGLGLFLRRARELGVDVSRETSDRHEAQIGTLTRWQKAIKLVGRRITGWGSALVWFTPPGAPFGLSLGRSQCL